MINPRQSVFPGIEPERDSAIDEAIDELRVARETLKSAQERVHKAEATLVFRMMERETARYDHRDDRGGGWAASIVLPTPTVRLKYLGNLYEGEDANDR